MNSAVIRASIRSWPTQLCLCSSNPMRTEANAQLEFEIAYVLLIDAVGYSKLLIDEQREIQQQLSAVVRSAEEVQAAEAQGKLLRLPTGDGVALVFSNTQEAPVRCAAQITEALSDFPQ